MGDGEKLQRFLNAMSGLWIVDRYSVDDSGKLRVHYKSIADPFVEWTHNPHGELTDAPMVGDVGMIGFIIKRRRDQ